METQKADGPPGLLLGNADSQMPAGLSRLAAVFENLHAVLEHSLAVVIVTDANGVIEYVNPRFAEVTGYTTAEAIGHHVTTISRDPAADEAAWLALDRGEPWRGEIRYERPDGGQYCALASIHPLRSSSGEITRYIGIHVDISEQKSTEAALQKREAYWRALVESAPDHILVVDREGTIQRMNRPPEVTPLDAVIGHSIFEFAAEESHESLREALRAVFECGENRTVEGRTIGPSGESYWHSNAIGPVRIGDRVVAAVVVARNVTERKEAEERLRKSEAHWRALVESAPSFIVTVDREGVISSVNREIDGGVPEDAVGHTIFEFAAEGAHETWRDALRDVFEHGERVQIENQASLTNGTMRWWACTVGPVREGDAVTSAVLVSHDITERREAEERLRAVATAVPDVIAVLDAEGTFIEFLVGSSNSPLAIGLQTELRGRNIDEFLPVKTAEWVRRFIRRTIRSNELQEAEDLFDLPAGKRWVMGRGAPLTLGDGTKAVVIHALDVTERKEMEQELQKLREDLEAQAQARLERGEAQGLTFREITVLSLISRGKSDKEIAALLGLSRFTVSKHAASIVKKMRAANRTEAVGRAVRDGVI